MKPIAHITKWARAGRGNNRLQLHATDVSS